MEWILRHYFFRTYFWLTSDMTLFILPFWFCSAPRQFCPFWQQFVKGREKLCFPILHQQDTFSRYFFLKQVVLIEKEGEKRRGAQQKYAHLSWASINSLPQNSSCEFGQLIGRHIFASATSAPGFSFHVRKKNISKKVQAQGYAVPSCCRKI